MNIQLDMLEGAARRCSPPDRCTMGIVFDLQTGAPTGRLTGNGTLRRRDYMKQWRIAHGQGIADSFMARASREARERRRQLVEHNVVKTNA